jgi:hypothetical protein
MGEGTARSLFFEAGHVLGASSAGALARLKQNDQPKLAARRGFGERPPVCVGVRPQHQRSLMKTYAALLVLACAATACDKGADSSITTTTSSNLPGNAAANTSINKRDQFGKVTPMDQGNNSTDLTTTANIRKALMADDSLSTEAKNIKVITGNGVITLRGPVKTEAEKSSIAAKAQATAGTNRVDNQIDVEAPTH